MSTNTLHRRKRFRMDDDIEDRVAVQRNLFTTLRKLPTPALEMVLGVAMSFRNGLETEDSEQEGNAVQLNEFEKTAAAFRCFGIEVSVPRMVIDASRNIAIRVRFSLLGKKVEKDYTRTAERGWRNGRGRELPCWFFSWLEDLHIGMLYRIDEEARTGGAT